MPWPARDFFCIEGKRDAAARAYVLGGGVSRCSSDRLRAEDAKRRSESIMDGRTAISLVRQGNCARPVMDVPRWHICHRSDSRPVARISQA